MQTSQPPHREPVQCPVCRAKRPATEKFCAICGAELNDRPAAREEELRGVLYLLSEIGGWEAAGRVDGAQAAELRALYERRRDELRHEMAARAREKASPRPAFAEEESAGFKHTQQPPETKRPDEKEASHDGRFAAFPTGASGGQRTAQPRVAPPPPPAQAGPQRTLLERLAEPRTLRLLLYTGASMLVVGVVIWLRDVLYLKLQEPVVQAGLLALGTLVSTVSGWYFILRTRQHWTGRALTLLGSLLVPVNFWFLVRSGLIANHGRAWVVCAFCALLYAHTAALLRERLYVYLACAATVGTMWALILRDAPRAAGLYALSLMAASQVFMHLACVFPRTENGEEKDASADDDEEDAEDWWRRRAKVGRWSRELWSTPLVRTAVTGAILSVLIYAPLRFASYEASSLYDGIFRLRATDYDASIAMLLLASCAYLLWFTGRYIYTALRALLYTSSAIALLLTVWVTVDGLRLRGETQVLILSLAALVAAVGSRVAQSRTLSQPLQHASLIASVLLAVASVSVLLNAQTYTLTHSGGFAVLAATFALLSAPRFGGRAEQTSLAHFSALYFSAAYFIALASASFKSETLVTLLCAAWPLALYFAGQLAAHLKREPQLTDAFTRVADVEFLLLLVWGSILALVIHFNGDTSRAANVCALAACVTYGGLRAVRQRSIYGTALGTLALVILACALFDALKKLGVWLEAWPIAAGAVAFSLLLQSACARLFAGIDEREAITNRPMVAAASIVLDVVVIACALLWFAIALGNIGAGGFGAPVVIGLALLYWVERAARKRTAWPVRVASAHTGALLIALLIALRVDAEWFALLFALTIFPLLFILSRRWHQTAWLSEPLNQSGAVALSFSLLLALVQAGPHLRAGDPALLAPSLAVGAIALLSFAASIFTKGRESVLYFRAGLWVAPLSLFLASLRAGFDPIEDVEIYTTPVAVLLLTVAYLSLRRAWEDYDRDAGALLWVGSLLLCAPLLLRSLEYRLLLDLAAPWRDVLVLVASLALVLYGVVGRMRAPVIVGSATLLLELLVLTLTSVDWLQVPLKYYLMSVGALLLIIFGTLEYRREQFLLVRRRFQERRDHARQQFGEWR